MGISSFIKSITELPKGYRFVGFLTKSIETVLPQSQHQKALVLLSRCYPRSNVTKVHIFFVPLFPLGVWVFVRTKQWLDESRVDLMRRRREIEAEVAEDISLERERGETVTYVALKKDISVRRYITDAWDVYLKRKKHTASLESGQNTRSFVAYKPVKYVNYEQL